MGQKILPLSNRLILTKQWRSKWFDRKQYAQFLYEDILIRRYIKKKLLHSGISKIEISRLGDKVKIDIYPAKAGIIIGRRGQEIDRLKEDIYNLIKRDVYIDIKEMKEVETDAQLIAEGVAFQLEKRVPFRRAMKKAISSALSHGIRGIRIVCTGRLAGAEIARSQGYREGKIPLHTFKANIDYGFWEAHTTYGIIGVKVWVYKGEEINKKLNQSSFGSESKFLNKASREKSKWKPKN
ncbi:MAG: 30S ribosomal protein S3 [Candidatus Omnitrophica bacterium 4484_213]|nr:MAG: 30S ribosomal protein S3 [Candidatus Omnitrophica bacterium 4484_213]